MIRPWSTLKRVVAGASLQARLAALAISLVLSTAVAIGAVQFHMNTAAQLEREGERQQSELRLAERYLQDMVGAARQQVAMLAATPPIQGLIRAERAGGVDPFDGSSEQLWKDRLAQIFEGVVQHAPSLLQVRYIQAANGGRELVRVDRKDDQVTRVEGERLQRKGRESYVVETLKAPPETIKIFDINLNREHGVIEVPHIPVMRVATPVYAEDGEIYGLVIINLDFRRILTQIDDLFSRVGSFYLTNEYGYFLSHRDPAKTFGFDLDRPFRIQSEHADAGPLLRGAERHLSVVEEGEVLGAYRKLAFDPEHSERFLLAAAFTPASEILATSFASRATIFLVVGMLVVINVVLAVILARHLVRPLKTLTFAANALRNGADVSEVRFPTERRDEVGDLATSFLEMAVALKQRQQALEQTNRELRRSNVELRDFAHVASHDLREPIRAASNHAGMLLELYADELSEEIADRLRRICALTERMAVLTSGLLEYSRLDLETERRPIDTRRLIEEIRQDLSELFEEKNAEIIVAEDLPAAIGSEAQIRIILQNLIVNGIKYNKSEARRIEIGWRPHARAGRPGGICFWVRDNGVGIEPEEQSTVFRIFKRLNRDPSFGEGTGLGLSFVKRVVEALGGEIWLDSAPGRGSTFYFTNAGEAQERPDPRDPASADCSVCDSELRAVA